MHKRKRSENESSSGERAAKIRKKTVEENISSSTKLLARAIKMAKGFERQKLGKRMKDALDAKNSEDMERVNREIDVLKGIDLGVLAEVHLWKILSRIKAFAENEELSKAKNGKTITLPKLGDADQKAWADVTSAMFNTKPVKDAMAQIVREMYDSLGIPAPGSTQGKKGKEIGNPNTRRRSLPPDRSSFSPSPSPASLDPLLPSSSASDSESEPFQAPKARKREREVSKLSSKSTFLSSLAAGFLSGSDSGSDIEDDAAPGPETRKNRPGQMARRAIWEKKFREQANHIKTGQGSVDQIREAKRQETKGSVRGRASGRGRSRNRVNFSRGDDDKPAGRQRAPTGDNAVPMGEKKRGRGKPDDIGVLHPSWQAAKKAKTEQKTATFAGKKVVFD